MSVRSERCYRRSCWAGRRASLTRSRHSAQRGVEHVSAILTKKIDKTLFQICVASGRHVGLLELIKPSSGRVRACQCKRQTGLRLRIEWPSLRQIMLRWSIGTPNPDELLRYSTELNLANNNLSRCIQDNALCLLMTCAPKDLSARIVCFQRDSSLIVPPGMNDT